jgi:hypothetical protein
VTPTGLFRVTATPASIHLADALSHELERGGATVEGGWVDRPEGIGWAITGSAAEVMSIVVHAPDTAAVHRAIASVQAATGHEVDVVVAPLDHRAAASSDRQA